VILAAGETVDIIDTGTPGVKVAITGAAGNTTNLGSILAAAGRIGMAGAIVKNSGTLNASSVVNEGGRIFLKASQDTYVDGNGRIVATGTKGGKVEVLGNRVAVMDNAEIDVSGTNGGGTILVGGDYQGKNADVQNSTITYFGPNAKLKADATDKGDGGKVIVWADDTTRAYGAISARGGSNGGNGGFVETSGKGYLDFRAKVDTSSPLGHVGTLLLDPTDITIYSSGTMYGSIDGAGIFNAVQSPALVGWDAIQTALDSNDVIIQTGSQAGSGNITVSGSPMSGPLLSITRNYTDSDGVTRTFTSTSNSPTYNSSHNLSLLAQGSITVNNNFGNYGTGAITLVAGWDGTSMTAPQTTAYTSGKNITLNAMIATNGSLTLKAADTVSVNATSNYAGIDMTNGTLSIIANSLILRAGYAGSGPMNMARIASAGNQYFTLGDSSNAGSLKLYGSNYGYGGRANIEQFGPGGEQQFTIKGGGTVLLQAGSGSEVSSNACSLGPCSGNGAQIENHGTGTQQFDFVNGGNLSLYGGSAGTNNSANIASNGAQVVTSSGQAPIHVSLIGGTGGSITSTNNFDNSAGMDSNTSQSINAFGGFLNMDGGGDANTFGGAYLGAPVQKLSFGSALLRGGNSNMQDKDGFGAPVAIGQKNSANITLDVGTLMIEGGAGATSPVGIGALYGSAAVRVTASTGALIYSGAGGVGIGSIGQAIAPGAAGGVYLAYGTSITAPAIWLGADTNVAVNGGLSATGGSFSFMEAAYPTNGFTGVNIYAGLGGSGDIVLGPQSSLSGTPINLVANGGKVIDNRTSAVTAATTSTIINTILNSTLPPPPPVVIPPPPTGGGSAGNLPGNVTTGGGDNEFGGKGSGEGSNGKDKDKESSGTSGNNKDDKPTGKKSVGRCNA
jgi:hypothetical protein